MYLPVWHSGYVLYNDVFFAVNSGASASGRGYEKADEADDGGGDDWLSDLYPLWEQPVFPQEEQRIRSHAGFRRGKRSACRTACKRAGGSSGKVCFIRYITGSTGVLSDLEIIPGDCAQYGAA